MKKTIDRANLAKWSGDINLLIVLEQEPAYQGYSSSYDDIISDVIRSVRNTLVAVKGLKTPFQQPKHLNTMVQMHQLGMRTLRV